MDFKQWRNFNTTGEWTKEIDVRGFIQANYTPLMRVTLIF